MKKVTKVFEVYRFSELSEPAKNRAIQYYNECMCDCDSFTAMCEWELGVIFPNSTLEVEYRVNCSQGDYFNFYGEIDLNDILNQIRGQLTKKQKRLFKHIIKSWKRTHTISCENYYGLNTAKNCNILDDVIGDMEYYGYRDIPEKDIVVIADIAGKLLSDTCDTLINDGYNYFYPDESNIAEHYIENNWYFNSDGTPYFD